MSDLDDIRNRIAEAYLDGMTAAVLGSRPYEADDVADAIMPIVTELVERVRAAEVREVGT